jgi:hypothetical protein
MAMAMKQYDTMHTNIAQWSTSQASLEVTRCSHWVSDCAALPWQPPWSTNLLKTQKNTSKKLFMIVAATVHLSLVVHENFIPQNEPSTQLINAASCVKM